VSIEAGVMRHPWNRDFVWQDHVPPFCRVTPEQARQFDELGFFVLEGVFDAATVTKVRDEIDRHEAKLEEVLRRQENDRILIAEAGAITFTTHLVTRSPRLRAFAQHRVFADLCVDLVGPDSNLYWDQAVYKKPEKPRRFPWHQDNGYTFVEPQQYLTCWVALTDATVDNGCPQVVPGLHRLGTLAHRYVDPLGFECFADPDNVVAAPVGAGGMVVFSSLTPHLTGPNATDDVRKAYILQYAPAGARIQQGDADSGPPNGEVSADDPERQFPVARDGHPLAS
jgi:ectoine hydroxylase-related dioxygenase (phytanoyl-CoA dioxygenase family)